jgi:hypothetical protein
VPISLSNVEALSKVLKPLITQPTHNHSNPSKMM